MFLKLLKHDFKYYAGNFMAIVVSIMCCTVLSILPNQVIINKKVVCFGPIKFFSVYAVIIMLMVCSVIIGIKIFNQKFISQESYLTFSLPVTKNQQLLSNLTVCLAWVVIVYFVLFVFVWLFAIFMSDFYFLYHVNELIDFALRTILDLTVSKSYLMGVIKFIVLHIMMINIIYFCIAFVNATAMKRFSKMFGIILFSAIICIYIIIIQTRITDWGQFSTPIINDIKCILVAVVFAPIFYFATHYILEKKIEVD